jgi:hypothetical protein
VVNVPPHTVADALATVRPVGRVSLIATPVSGSGFPVGLVMVNVSELVALRAIPAGLKTFANEGGASAFTDAEAVPPVPPSVEVTLPVVVFFSPADVPVTFTEKVHELVAAKLAPDKLTDPAVVAIVPPPQLPVRPFGADTVNPAGRLSVKATPVSVVVVLLFWTVKLNEVEPFKATLAAPKALLITGGPTTVVEAFAVLPVPASVEITDTLLFFTPTVTPCTFTKTVQAPLEASVPPERLTVDPPEIAVAVPPQVLLRVGMDPTIKPPGRLSVNASPVRARLVFGLLMAKVRSVVPFNGIVAAPNALLIAGAVATIRLAEAVLPAPPLVEVTLPVVFVN